MKVLKIIIFDGSFETTPFINRLVKGLAVRHQVYILGFNEKISQPLINVNYVSLGSNQNKFKFFITAITSAFGSREFNTIHSTLKKLLKGDRRGLQQQHLDIALKKISPDIVHLQWPSVIPWFEEVLLQQKIPVVLSQRGFHSNVRPFVDKENFNYLQKWFPKIAGFHSVSKAIQINGDKIWDSSEKLNSVVYTGLPLRKIIYSDNYPVSKSVKILSIGRAHWIKGYDYALHTCVILKEKNISFQYKIIGGAGDEELQFLVHDLELADCVKLVSRTTQEEVFNIMRESSLLLLPSLEEGIPNVVVEAMAIGLPVISTNCGGVAELISDGVNGFIVPRRNSKAMAEAVVAFADLSIEKILEMRAAARGKVEQQHSEDQMVLGMEELYYEVLGGY